MTTNARSEATRSILGRADVILGAFDAAHSTLSLQGLTARTGIPKTSVRRTVEMLTELNWLERHGNRFSIGCRLSRIAHLSEVHTRIRITALPYLEELHHRTGEAVHLAVLLNGRALIVESTSGRSRTASVMSIGIQLPTYCTALGKVLAAYDEAAAHTVMLTTRLTARTTSTITSPARLRRELDSVRADGVAVDREEYRIGLTCVAAPLDTGNTACAAAVSVTGGAARLVAARMRLPIQQTAQSLSTALRRCDPGIGTPNRSSPAVGRCRTLTSHVQVLR